MDIDSATTDKALVAKIYETRLAFEAALRDAQQHGLIVKLKANLPKEGHDMSPIMGITVYRVVRP